MSIYWQKETDFNYITRKSEDQVNNHYRELEEQSNNILYLNDEPVNKSFSCKTCLYSILIIIIFIIVIIRGYYYQ